MKANMQKFSASCLCPEHISISTLIACHRRTKFIYTGRIISQPGWW